MCLQLHVVSDHNHFGNFDDNFGGFRRDSCVGRDRYAPTRFPKFTRRFPHPCNRLYDIVAQYLIILNLFYLQLFLQLFLQLHPSAAVAALYINMWYAYFNLDDAQHSSSSIQSKSSSSF